jgi:hypothetical protein
MNNNGLCIIQFLIRYIKDDKVLMKTVRDSLK